MSVRGCKLKFQQSFFRGPRCGNKKLRVTQTPRSKLCSLTTMQTDKDVRGSTSCMCFRRGSNRPSNPASATTGCSHSHMHHRAACCSLRNKAHQSVGITSKGAAGIPKAPDSRNCRWNNSQQTELLKEADTALDPAQLSRLLA